jgi:hypothetical protein
VRAGASVLSLLLGLGFGLPGLFGIKHFAQTGEVWTFTGFPTYGEGPFERIGLYTSVPLLLLFLAACIAEIVLAWTLWTGAPWAP